MAQNIRDAETTASATERLSGEVASAAEIMDEKAEQLSEQVAHLVLQLRASASPSSPAALSSEPERLAISA